MGPLITAVSCSFTALITTDSALVDCSDYADYVDYADYSGFYWLYQILPILCWLCWFMVGLCWFIGAVIILITVVTTCLTNPVTRVINTSVATVIINSVTTIVTYMFSWWSEGGDTYNHSLNPKPGRLHTSTCHDKSGHPGLLANPHIPPFRLLLDSTRASCWGVRSSK